MAKYLDLNGVKRLAGQLWGKVKTLAAGKEDIRPLSYVTITMNNSTSTLNFGRNYFVATASTAVTSASLNLKLPTDWKTIPNMPAMDIFLKSTSGAKFTVVSAEGFGIYKTKDFSLLNTKTGAHLRVTFFHETGSSTGTMVCEVNQMV